MIGITKTAVKRPIAIIVLVAGLIIFGLSSILNMSLQLIPDMEMPMLIIQTVYPQAGPEDVEKLVTKKIEDTCGTISGLDQVMSRSMENVSLVILSFDYGTDIDDAYMDVQSAVGRIKGDLPEKANDPIIIEMDINAAPVMQLSVTNKNGADCLGFVNDTLTPEIEKISSVAQVETAGGQKSYISVQLIPEKLTQYGLNLNSVAQTVGSANFTMPAGSKEYGRYDVAMTTQAEYKTPDEIGTIPITTSTGNLIHLSDIAIVHYAKDDVASMSRYDGTDNIGVSITKEQSASAVTVSKEVKYLIKDFESEYPDYDIAISYDSSDTIIASLLSIFKTLVLGVVLTMLVLFVFFGDFKGSLIVGSSMPISLLMTLLVMSFAGFSLNMMTMGALVIAIGMMVDNSIVVIEMCFREKENKDSFADAAVSATGIVMNSIIASTLTTVVVYLPLALMKSLSGQMFGQLGYTIVFALIASLISAITIVPLCFAVYKPVEKKKSIVNDLLDSFSAKYANVLSKLLKKKKTTFLAAVIILGISVYLIQFINVDLMSETDEGQVTISVDFRPGTKVEYVDEKMREIEAFVKNYDYIGNYSTEVDNAKGTVNAYVAKGNSKKVVDIIDEWTEATKDYADNCDVSVSAGSSMGGSMGGSGNAYTVTYESTDLEILKSAANDIKDVIGNVDGVISVSTSFGDASSKAEIKVDPIKAVANNLTPSMVGGSIYSIMQGSEAFETTINGNEYKVKVEYPKDEYKTVNDVYEMTLTNAVGKEVPLQDVADIVYTDAPQTIAKSRGLYTVDFNASMLSENKYDVQKAIEKALEEHKLPAHVEKTVSTRTRMINKELGAIGGAIITAIILVYMVMAIEFEDLRYSGVVMVCIPFAVIGSVVFLLVTGNTFNMTSMLGFMMLVGIVVNNGILYVDTTNQYRKSGMHTEDALVATGVSRIRPILMTTLTTILSMVPMALGIGKNGTVMQSMALVICGGLLASTVLTLIMLPVFYMIIHKRSVQKINKRKERAAAATVEKADSKELVIEDVTGDESLNKSSKEPEGSSSKNAENASSKKSESYKKENKPAKTEDTKQPAKDIKLTNNNGEMVELKPGDDK